MAAKIAVLVKGYPRLSETFIAQEIEALEVSGLELTIVSLRHPTDQLRHDLHARIAASVLYLPEYLHHEPVRVLKGLWYCLTLATAKRALNMWLHDLVRDVSRNRVRRFGQAAVLARELDPEARLLYNHYIHTPASVGRYCAVLLALPFAISAHAKDIWTTPDWEKRAKLQSAVWTVTCTRRNSEHLTGLAPSAHIECLYHGIDLTRFPLPGREAGTDGKTNGDPVRILAVARAVEKKGLDLLIGALSRLPHDLNWRFVHIGAGPLQKQLAAQAEKLGLRSRIEWLGACDQSMVLQAMREADIFCLPARVASDGDRDGLPNVIMEAMSQELAVVTTNVGAICELAVAGRNAVIVPDGNAPELAIAIETLARDPERRIELGSRARRDVASHFAFGSGVRRIGELLRDAVGTPAAAR